MMKYLTPLLDQLFVVFFIPDGIRIGRLNGVEDIFCHDFQSFGRCPDVRIDAMCMVVFLRAVFSQVLVCCGIGCRTVCDVSTGPLDELNPSTEVYDLVLVLNLVDQRVFEVDQAYAEDHPGLVDFDELPGSRFEGFGAGAFGDDDLDLEIISDDLFDDAFQRQNGNTELSVLDRFRGRAGHAERECSQQNYNVFHTFWRGGRDFRLNFLQR